MSTGGLTIDDLERWVLFGADWRVVDLSDELVVVDLCACTGEPLERRQSDDPVLIGYVRAAQSEQPRIKEPGAASGPASTHRRDYARRDRRR
jgi:hypothetical protein